MHNAIDSVMATVLPSDASQDLITGLVSVLLVSASIKFCSLGPVSFVEEGWMMYLRASLVMEFLTKAQIISSSFLFPRAHEIMIMIMPTCGWPSLFLFFNDE